jgi:hypothetical protein
MSPLLKQFSEIPENRLEEAEVDSVDARKFGRLLPEDAREFFATFSSGFFYVVPLKLHLMRFSLDRSVNDLYVDDYYTHTFPYYDKCILFAGAEGSHFSFGLDLNEERRGWVFGYEDEGLGVSERSYYIFTTFSDFLENAIASTRVKPSGVEILASSSLGPVLRK